MVKGKILVLDNYDSFTYNLVHLLRTLSQNEITVLRNDALALEEVKRFDKILLSPGPGIPLEAGIMPDLVKQYGPTKSIFGVCLGHQCIGEVYGGMLRNLGTPVHGKGIVSIVTKKDERLFKGLPERFVTGRYHSWVVDREKLPNKIVITAQDENGEIMALAHSEFDVRGVQFHPESVLTEHGAVIVGNWLAA